MPFTISLHRVLKAPVERVFRAFSDADAMVKWNPPHGFTAHMHAFEPVVGGAFRMSFTNFSTQQTHSFGGTYLDIVADSKISYSDKFDDPSLPGEMITTVEFKPVAVGTDIQITQAGIPDMIPESACYLGWQESLGQLALLVEPDIREG
ncbi:SRPBCC family protein [Rhizobium sp. SGZ-381]|uniref:SRPBCC family protein n=1 Tax=Rhizobium sp. SGZ-381 TaxID=3342800 RepID=UPI00366E0E5B